MSDIIKSVDYILNTYGKLDNEFGELAKVYLMTTENIKDFLQQHDLNDKEVLTVAGSGDQMLNAYLMGAKNVTCFDINPLAFYQVKLKKAAVLAFYQVKLKKAAVLALTYEEFLQFFFSEFNSLFDRKLFEKIATELDQDTLDFFNYLYQNYDNNQILEKIYYRFHPKLEHIIHI